MYYLCNEAYFELNSATDSRRINVLTEGDVVEKHTRIKDLAFSAYRIYNLNEIQGQDVSLVSQALAPFRREMLRSRVNLACKFHKKMFSIEAGIVVSVPKHISVSDSRVASFHSFLFKIRLVSQVCSSAILMLQV